MRGGRVGLIDKVKDLFSGHKDEAKEGVDKAGEIAKEKLPDQSDKVDTVTEKAKGVVDDS